MAQRIDDHSVHHCIQLELACPTTAGNVARLCWKAHCFVDMEIRWRLREIALTIRSDESCKTPLLVHKFYKSLRADYDFIFKDIGDRFDSIVRPNLQAIKRPDGTLSDHDPKIKDEYAIMTTGVLGMLLHFSHRRRKITEKEHIRAALLAFLVATVSPTNASASFFEDQLTDCQARCKDGAGPGLLGL